MASLALRCFWEGYSAGSGRGGNSFKKTAALMAALLAEFPTKRFYLKVDADSVLRPQNLLLFLARVAKRMDSTAAAAPTTATATAAKGNVPAAPPLYFGSAFAPPICPYADARCKNIKSFSFNFGAATPARGEYPGSATGLPRILLPCVTFHFIQPDEGRAFESRRPQRRVARSGCASLKGGRISRRRLCPRTMRSV